MARKRSLPSKHFSVPCWLYVGQSCIAVEELPKLSGTVGSFVRWNADQNASGILNAQNLNQKFPSYASENSTNANIEIAFGGNQPHNNQSPGLGAYVWHRTA